MKKWLRFEVSIIAFVFMVCLVEGCKEKAINDSDELALNTGPLEEKTNQKEEKKPLSEEFKEYWYSGNAEITSYELKQARYGQLRDGKAVLIYVTEPFLPEKQVKADRNNADNVSVLKLNATKKYLTGIYPYSIMASTFYPVYDNQHAIKTSLSVQEWCGQVYTQLNNRDQFELTSHSYFESEADQNFTIGKTLLENEVWNKMRINPSDLPLGEIEILPSLEFFRLSHQEVRALKAKASLTTENGINTYSIDYKDIERKLSIQFSTDFPYTIEGWKEEFKSGFGPKAKVLTSSAKKLKRIKTAYWGQNSNKDVVLRDSLAL